MEDFLWSAPVVYFVTSFVPITLILLVALGVWSLCRWAWRRLR